MRAKSKTVIKNMGKINLFKSVTRNQIVGINIYEVRLKQGFMFNILTK